MSSVSKEFRLPSSPTNGVGNLGGIFRGENESMVRKLVRPALEKSVARQPGKGKSAMEINAGRWGSSSNRNKYSGGQRQEDEIVKTEEEIDGFMPVRRDQLVAHFSGQMFINFFTSLIESHVIIAFGFPLSRMIHQAALSRFLVLVA